MHYRANRPTLEPLSRGTDLAADLEGLAFDASQCGAWRLAEAAQREAERMRGSRIGGVWGFLVARATREVVG